MSILPLIDNLGDKMSYKEYTVREHPGGNKEWYKDGLLHRDNDQPAIEKADGSKYWYKEGKFHRDGDKPAVESANGSKSWYKEGKLHRDNDQPAVVYSNGDKFWYKEGKLYTPNLKETKSLTLVEIEKLLGFNVNLVSGDK